MDYRQELQNAGWVYKDGSRAVGDFANPTLEELIEACGERFVKLSKPTRKKYWVACSKAEENKPWPKEKGSTPIEAVARLWLSINKK